MAYLELPLDASRVSSNTAIGIRIYTPAAQVDSLSGRAWERPALADLKFTRQGLAGIYIQGVNVIPPSLVVRADEASGEAAGINWLIPVGIVAIGAIGIIHSNRSSKRSPEPGPEPAAACVPVFLPPPGPGGPPPPAPC